MKISLNFQCPRIAFMFLLIPLLLLTSCGEKKDKTYCLDVDQVIFDETAELNGEKLRLTEMSQLSITDNGSNFSVSLTVEVVEDDCEEIHTLQFQFLKSEENIEGAYDLALTSTVQASHDIKNLSDSLLNILKEITEGSVEITKVMDEVYTISVDAKYDSSIDFTLKVEHDFSK